MVKRTLCDLRPIYIRAVLLYASNATIRIRGRSSIDGATWLDSNPTGAAATNGYIDGVWISPTAANAVAIGVQSTENPFASWDNCAAGGPLMVATVAKALAGYP